MKLHRFRAPALAATAVLVISGAGIAFAANPAPATVTPAAPLTQAEPVGPDTDQLQQGDQTTPDVAGAAAQAEPIGPDTDQLQQGDQTTPDVAGAAAAAAGASTTKVAATKAAPEKVSESSAEAPDGTEASGTESDGPGGHQDPEGQNVDHQFDGEE